MALQNEATKKIAGYFQIPVYDEYSIMAKYTHNWTKPYLMVNILSFCRHACVYFFVYLFVNLGAIFEATGVAFIWKLLLLYKYHHFIPYLPRTRCIKQTAIVDFFLSTL